MKWRNLSQAPALSLLFLLLTTSLWSSVPDVEKGRGAEILWDTYGVPHIFAKSEVNAHYAFGWAQMAAHGDLLLRLYGVARGRGAEYWGGSYLNQDKWVLKNDIPARAKRWYGQQDPDARKILDAFVAGLNAYGAQNRDKLDDELERVLPITGADVLAHIQRAIHFNFVAGEHRVKRISNDWAPGGSNAWAIGPKRSASGNAMLLVNPHLPWGGFFTWFEAHIKTRSTHIYGATLVGQPTILMGFNDRLGWAHTVNTHDGMDLYELDVTDGAYRWDNGTKPLTYKNYQIKIKKSDGSFRTEVMNVAYSVHGPVVREWGDRFLALRTVGLDQPHVVRQYLKMAQAKNLKQFEKAISQLQNPMFTVIYADRDGHIMHLFGGQTPVRNSGGWNDWKKTVPGHSSANLWTRTHAYEDLPKIVDPPSGWLQNANDPPWTTTFPTAINPDDYPAYMAPRKMKYRAQHSAGLLFQDESITFDEMVMYKHSTRMEVADRFLDDLEKAVAEHGSDGAKEAMVTLKNWDRKTEANSKGAVLFKVFFEEYYSVRGHGVYEVDWLESKPRTTPDGLARPKEAAATLARVASWVQREAGSLDVPWGAVHRFRRDDVDLPGNGGGSNLGLFRTVSFLRDKDGRYKATGGDSFVAAVEFSKPVKAKVLLSYGNASQSGSPHRTDQLKLLSEKKLRDALLTRSAIEANLKMREQLPPFKGAGK